jgi:multidrug efflux pump subunit AcrA (membrane-fusion protein)
MGKVVTSAGLNEFVQSGKFEEIKPDGKQPSSVAPPLEVAKTPPPDAPKVEEPKDEHVDEDPETQAEIDKSERFRKAMNRKHYALKQAEAQLKKVQDEAAESERFSEQQYNERRQAEARLAQLERELGELRAKSTPSSQPPELKEPNENDPKYVVNGQFDWKTYTRDQSEYVASQKLADYQKSQEVERARQAQIERETRAKTLVDEAKKQHEDFDEKVAVMVQRDYPIHTDVKEYMEESPQLGHLIYYFANHPDFIERINKLTPKRAVAAVRDIERAFEQPAPVKEPEKPVIPQQAVSGAPPPITPLPTSASVNVNTDPSKMDFKQLRAYERERTKRRS